MKMKHFKDRLMQLRSGLSTPLAEHVGRMKQSEDQLRKESRVTQGQVIGAAAVGGGGAGYLLRKTKNGKFAGRAIHKGVRGKAALMAGGMGAVLGSTYGGLVGAHVRKGKKKDLAARLEELHEFAAPVRSVTKLMKTSKRNPLAIRKTPEGEFRVAQKGSATAGPMGYYTDDINDARNTAAVLLKKERRQMKTRSNDLAARLEELHEFVSLVRERGSDSLYDGEDCGPTMYVSGLADPEVMSMPKEGTAMVRYKVRSRSVNERGDMPTYGADIAISTLEPVKAAAGKKEMGILARLREFAGRERNPSGQFISGVSSNPDDMAMAYKKKVGKIAGAAVLGGGAAMAAMPAGRAALGRAGQSMLRGAGRALIR